MSAYEHTAEDRDMIGTAWVVAVYAIKEVLENE